MNLESQEFAPVFVLIIYCTLKACKYLFVNGVYKLFKLCLNQVSNLWAVEHMRALAAFHCKSSLFVKDNTW